MTEQAFFDYVIKFGAFQKRSMFGGVGLFQNEAMYSLISEERIFIRGGGHLDSMLTRLGCEKYKHVKKQTTATVNYYDITDLFVSENEELDAIVAHSIQHSVKQRSFQKSSASRRFCVIYQTCS